jgi:hypothetical protein
MANIQTQPPVNVQFNFNTLSNRAPSFSNMSNMSQFAFGAPQPSYNSMSNMQPQQYLMNQNIYQQVQPSMYNNDPYAGYQQQQIPSHQPNVGNTFAFGGSPSTFGMAQPSAPIGYAQPRMVQHNARAIKQAQSNYKAATTY